MTKLKGANTDAVPTLIGVGVENASGSSLNNRVQPGCSARVLARKYLSLSAGCYCAERVALCALKRLLMI